MEFITNSPEETEKIGAAIGKICLLYTSDAADEL